MVELIERDLPHQNEIDEIENKETRLSLRLSPEARQTLEWIANEREVSFAEAIRRALGTERFFIEKMKEGSSVLIEDKKSKRIREVILR